MKALVASDSALEQLDQALNDERQALLNHDVLALITATEHKLHALQRLEGHPPMEQASYMRELAERNRANGLLLIRRRHEMDWALRYLGRNENAAYTARGQEKPTAPKPLVVV